MTSVSGIRTFVLSILIAAVAASDQAPTVPPGDNAALRYWAAFTFIPAADSADGRAIESFSMGYDPGPGELPAGAAQAMRLLRDGAAIAECRWGTDIERDGPDALLPHLAQARSLSRFTGLISYRLAEAGRVAEAVDDLVAQIAFARHLQNPEGTLSDFLVGISCEAMAHNRIAALIPQLDRGARPGLADRLDGLRPAAPLAACVHSERGRLRWMLAHLDSPTPEPTREPAEALNQMHLAGVEHADLAAIDPFGDLDRARIPEMAEGAMADLDALERLWAASPLQFPAALKTFEARSFNALSEEIQPSPSLWRARYHGERGFRLLLAALRCGSYAAGDPALFALGIRVEPGPPPTLLLDDPPELATTSSKPMRLVIGRTFHHGPRPAASPPASP